MQSVHHRPVAKLSRSIGLPLTPKAVKYLDVARLQAVLVHRPDRAAVPVIGDEHLVVEYYAR